MSIRLKYLRFRGHPGADDGEHRALPMRQNQAAEIPTHEWERGRSALPEDSKVCYAISQTSSIRVDLGIGHIAASEKQPPAKRITLQAREALAVRVGGPPDSDVQLPGEGEPLAVFGDSRKTRFDHGEDSIHVYLDFPAPRFAQAGVGAYSVAIRWYNLETEETVFAVTWHRIYIVIDNKLPVGTKEAELSQVTERWSDALDLACSWAAGCRDARTALGAVTLGVHALGPEVFRYSGKAAWFTTKKAGGEFALSRFLHWVRSESGQGCLNCTDCAAAVHVFAAMLGVPSRIGLLKQSNPPRLPVRGMFELAINPVVGIGWPRFLPASSTGGFEYHAVVWLADTEEPDFEDQNDPPIYDAAVRLARDKPAVLPQLVAQLNSGEKLSEYLRRLAVGPACLSTWLESWRDWPNRSNGGVTGFSQGHAETTWQGLQVAAVDQTKFLAALLTTSLTTLAARVLSAAGDWSPTWWDYSVSSGADRMRLEIYLQRKNGNPVTAAPSPVRLVIVATPSGTDAAQELVAQYSSDPPTRVESAIANVDTYRTADGSDLIFGQPGLAVAVQRCACECTWPLPEATNKLLALFNFGRTPATG